jgi:hypothetical protein
MVVATHVGFDMNLTQRIEHWQRAHRGAAKKLATARMLWCALVGLAALVAADVVLQMPGMARTLLVLGWLAGLAAVWWTTYRSQTTALAPSKMVARLVEQSYPGLANDLVSALEFSEALASGPSPIRGSTVLMQRHVSTAAAEADEVDVFTAVRPPESRREWMTLAGVAIGTVALAALCFDMVTVVLPRLLLPFADLPPYCGTQFAVEPGHVAVDYGDNVKVTVRASGRVPGQMSLVWEDDAGGDAVELPMFEAQPGYFFQTFENVRSAGTYHARIDRGRSHRYALSLAPWPRMDTVMVTCVYPSYMRRQSERRLLGEKLIRVYRDTQVTLSITSNKPLRDGTLTVGGETLAMSAQDDRTVAATFTARGEGVFSAQIADRDGNASRETLLGKIEIAPDVAPDISMVNPTRESFAVPTAVIPVKIEARDDMGVARIDLFRRLNGSDDDRKTLHASSATDRFVTVSETIDLGDLGVRPGDVVDVYATATDNLPDSPQTVATPSHQIRVISEGAYREFMQMQAQEDYLTAKYGEYMEKLEALAKAQETLAADADRLLNKVMSGNVLNEEDRKRVGDMRSQQQELADRAAELSRTFAEQARQTPLYDVEAEYQRELAAFAKAVAEAQAEMTRAAQALDQAGQSSALSEQGGQLDAARSGQDQALKKLGRVAGEFRKRIDQANQEIEKIARLQNDVEQFKHLLGLQRDLERQTKFFRDIASPGSEDRSRLKELSAQQQAVRKSLAELKENFRHHAAAVEEAYPKVAADARQIADEIEARGIEQKMQAAADKLEMTDSKGGHTSARDAFEQMMAMVAMCENASGEAERQCDMRLRIEMSKGLGQTLPQMGRGMRPGMGRAQGMKGQGTGGMRGMAAPFDLYGKEQVGTPTTRSSRSGHKTAKAQSVPDEPTPKAVSVEEVTQSRRVDHDWVGGGGEQYIEEYRRVTEEYFKRMAEDNQ